MTAVEALRMARETATGPTTAVEPRTFWMRECITAHGGCQCVSIAASAILDGFSVDEVTSAEHTTDRPHE